MNTPPIDTTGHTAALTGRSGRQEQKETGPKLTQPTADKSPVRIDTAASPKGRTLDEQYPRRIAGTSSPSIRHHEDKRPVTADEVREPFEAATRKIEAEAIDTIDDFTDAFVGGLQEAEEGVRRIHGSLVKLDGSLVKLGQTIERGFGGIREDLQKQNEHMDALGKRFNTGLEESRVVRQRIVESMRQENADYKNMVEKMDRTIQKVSTRNKKTAAALSQLKTKRETNESKQRTDGSSTAADNPTGTGKKTGAELLAEMRAQRKARESARQDKNKE